MPIARLNTTRNRSHSQPPSSNSDKRQFLPPSYYAAAAGITYPNNKSSSQCEFLEATPSTTSHDSSGDPQEYPNTFMPVSYTSESGTTSDSSFEFKVTSNSRYSTSGRILSSKTPVQSKRQSHLAGLPQLETNLLPSLRDTIDRMTRTPSHAGSFSTSTPAEKLKSTESVLSMGSPSLSSPLPPSSSVLTDEFPRRSGPSEPTHKVPPPTNTPVELTTTRLKTPKKSVLKSALRAPTPRLFSNPSLGVEAMGNSTSGGVSLKSVRSILSRKASWASLSETPTPSGNLGHKSTTKKQTGSPSFQHLRVRSRTEPVTGNSESHTSSNSTALPPGTNHASAPPDSIKQKFSTSGIPRLRRKFEADYRPDDSDFDLQYENQERERRRLVVTNAEVFASSSESETDVKERNWTEIIPAEPSNGYRGPNLDSYVMKNRIGLGFHLRNNTNGRQGRNSREWNLIDQNQREGWPSEDNVEQWDTTTWAPGTRSQSSRYRAPKEYEPNSDSYFASLDADHRRRRAALLGIVSGLDLQPSAVTTGESEESEYYGEDGVAISGSGELGQERPPSVKADFGSTSQANGSKDYSEIRHRREFDETQRPSRPRSSSHMSIHAVSTDNENSRITHEPLSPRRSRSTDQHFFPLPTVTSGTARSHKASRSPVVRQDNLSPMPAALRKHSVYHHPLGSNARARSSNDRKSPKKCNYDQYDSPDALIITERSYAAAARERQAFGIPPSESLEVYRGTPHDEIQPLSHADSDLSSVYSQYWDEDENEFSTGAETLFRKLSGSPVKEKEKRNYQDENAKRLTRFSVISTRSSVPSVYDDQGLEDQWQDYGPASEPTSNETHSTNSIPEKDYDNVEIQRQDLIQEICQTEEAFVNRLHIFVQLFILPLRVQDTKTWIVGVPSEVARLFDWLDDILNLHRELLFSLQSGHTVQDPITEHIAGSIYPFVPRFQVYQPYLVRVPSVTNLIQQLVQDEKSDFGEFVDLQEGAAECDGWKLDKFLAEPINRLGQYPDFFSRLIKLTPKTHPDYLSTFLLLHSTEMMIRVMTEVKVREDEYDLIKNFSSRIGGLPSGSQIATRERRLLFHGILHLLTVDGEEVTISGNTLFPANGPQAQNNRNLANRTSRLASAVSLWDSHRGRSESTSSASTGTSLDTASSRALSDTPSSTFFPSFRIRAPERPLGTARLLNQKKVLMSPSPNPRGPRIRGVPTQVFIFTDFVLLATLNSGLAPINNDWTLLEDVGITRVIGISESLEQNSSEETPLDLDIIPVDIERLGQCPSEEDGPVVSLRFILPTTCGSLLPTRKSPYADNKTKNSWISAFQKCSRFTLQSATFLSRSKNYGNSLHTDLEYDTQQTVLSLLASGLPLPKSPSAQLVDSQHGQPTDIRKQEREERGWWSLRFQQVFRELQRQDMSVPI